RNSRTSSALVIPPIPMIGTPGMADAISHTMRTATGLIAGPERPPVLAAIRGARFRQSIAMPFIVLMAEMPSAPPSIAAFAIGTMSVMFGVSFANTGRDVAFLARRQTFSVALGSTAWSVPWETLGQEMLSSKAST